ncbi:MAG: JAB domain-containing protein [Candidatus Anammoximicrobium sp.]|nr:JAB domain-containing protein [Candidatus Anammoximicrobium sp.]
MRMKTTKKRIGRPADVAPVFRAILDAEGEIDQAKEHFWALFLDTKGHILRIELVTLGLLDQTMVHPREVFRPAIGISAKSVILCHNHPSGDPEPSDKDIQLTRRLIEAGKLLDVRVLDHVIIGEGSEWRSIAEVEAMTSLGLDFN